MTERRLRGVWLGRQPYEPIHELQQRLLEARHLGQIDDTVLLLEHDTVITLGRGAHGANVLFPPQALEQRGVQLVETGRGGDVTLHAPGQLVCYPIIALPENRRDVRRYVNDLTETMRQLALRFGVSGGKMDSMIGLWVDRKHLSSWPGEGAAVEPAKLGAIGVRVSRWVTMHGFALNLTTDLDLFRLIVPCGISTFGVTSIQELTGKAPAVSDSASVALEILTEQLDFSAFDFDDRSSADVTGMAPAEIVA